MDIFNDEKTLKNLSKNKHYWSNGSFEERWKYMSFVIDTIKDLGITSDILEIGTNGLPLTKISTQLELKSENSCNPNLVIHDLNQFPFPFTDKQFKLSVALQVWEHLEDKMKSFKELKRVSQNIILSLPYKWQNKADKVHYNIDENTIAAWTNNEKFTFRKVIDGRVVKRIVYLWENLD